MNNVRIAMLGSGFVAEFYMQGLANVNGHEVVVNYSRSGKRAKPFAERWGIPESTTSLGAVLTRDDIDLFIIALPNEEQPMPCVGLSQLAITNEEFHHTLKVLAFWDQPISCELLLALICRAQIKSYC